ncbi:MAG: MFS transporter [Acidobacteria bacterium]|nr:MFS transporter [Acidobacteriota bacterium]
MTTAETTVPPGRDVPKVIWSWAMYDWANSAFTTLVVTFIYSFYFTQAFSPDEETGTLWWSRAVALSAILTALASPVLGAAADRGGARKRYMAVALVVCVVATSALAFITPDMANGALVALAVFIVADLAFEIGNVFYNAFLPTIASPQRIGRVSGYAWGLGYVGGTVCMGIALFGFVQPDVPWFGMAKDPAWNARATNLLVAVWFLLFSLPFFFVVPETRVSAPSIGIAASFRGLRETARNLRRFKELVKFLVARLVFNDGLVTVFAFGSIYASKVFGMTLSEVILFGVWLNVTSGVGAFIFGYVDDRIGGKKTIQISIVMMSVATAMAVWAPTKDWFWVAGSLLGIFVGPNQSASRSLMGRFVPAKHEAEFFGFFAFSGKATAFAGPLLLGVLTDAFSSHRVGMASILLFFLVGGLLLVSVDEAKGIAAARET